MAYNRYDPWEAPELVDWEEDYSRSENRCLPIAAVGIAAIGAIGLCRPSRYCRPRCHYYCSPRRYCYPRNFCYPYGCYPYTSCTPTYVCYPM